MAQDVEIRIKAALDTLDSAKSMSDYKKSLRELKGLGLEVGDTNAEAFSKITQAIGSTNDKISDFNAVIKSTSGEPIENITSSFRGLEGSLRSLDFKSFKQQFDVLGTSVKALGKDLFGGFNVIGSFNSSMAQGNTTMKALTTSTAQFGKALIATGIGAFVVAVGLLVAYYDDLAVAGGALGEAAKGANAVWTSFKDTLYNVAVNLKLVAERESEGSKQAIIDGEKRVQVQKDLNEQLNNTIDFQLRLSKAQGKYTVKEEIEANNKRIKSNEQLLTQLTITGAKYLTKLADQEKGRLSLTQEEIESYKKKAEENEKSIKDITRQNEKLAQDSIILAEQEKTNNRKKNEDIRKENEKHNLELMKQKAIRDNQDTLDTEKQQMTLAGIMETYNKHYTQIDADFLEIQKTNQYLTNLEIFKLLEDRYKKEEDLRLKAEKDKLDFDMQSEESARTQQEKLLDIQTEYAQSTADVDRIWAELAAENVGADYDRMLQLLENRLKKEKELKDKNAKDTKDNEEKSRKESYDTFQNAIALAQNAYSAMGEIENLFYSNKRKNLKKGSDEDIAIQKKQFERNKSMQVGLAIINGIAAVGQVMANDPDPTGISQAIRITTIALQTAGQVAKIKATQFNAEGGSSSGGGDVASPTSNLPNLENRNTQMSAAQTLGIGQTPMSTYKPNDWMKVYVTEGDIRNVTGRVEVIETRSKLGA